MAALKPPQNVRDVLPPCCANCRYLGSAKAKDEGPYCRRDPEGETVAFDSETIYTTICDLFRRELPGGAR